MGVRPRLIAMIGLAELKATRKRVTDPRAVSFAEFDQVPGGVWDMPWFQGPVQETLAIGADADRIMQECRRTRWAGAAPNLDAPLATWLADPGRANYSDLFVYERTQLPRVVGVILPYHYHERTLSLYDDTMTRMLAATQFGKRPRVLEIPPETPDNDAGLARTQSLILDYPEMAEALGDRDQIAGASRRFPFLGTGLYDKDFVLAHKILHRIGFDFALAELKLLLYWHWA